FLRPVAGTSRRPGSEARITYVHASRPRDLWVQFGEIVLFSWGAVPGEEAPGQLSAVEKLQRLRDWIERYHPAEFPAGRPHHFEFTKGGIAPYQGRKGP